MHSITLFPYWKNGDDFNSFLEHSKGNVTEALQNWAARLQDVANQLINVAEAIKDVGAFAEGDTHLSLISGLDEELAASLAAKFNIVALNEFDEDEDESEP